MSSIQLEKTFSVLKAHQIEELMPLKQCKRKSDQGKTEKRVLADRWRPNDYYHLIPICVRSAIEACRRQKNLDKMKSSPPRRTLR
jgi:hypothetical protein